MSADKKVKISLVFLVLTLFPIIVLGLPQPATEIYGEVQAYGIAAPAGLIINSYDPDSVLCGTFTSIYDGYYGLLSCMSDDDSTAVDEGASYADNISFRINSSNAFIIEGNNTWQSGVFQQIRLLALTNNSPYFDGCINASAEEDYNSSNISIDLWNCGYDGSDDSDDLTYGVRTQSNSTLVDCSISSNRYLTCGSSVFNGFGNNDLVLELNNTLGFGWDTQVRINIDPINDSPFFNPNLTNQTAVEGVAFIYDIDCTDYDGDTIIYAINDSEIGINSSTGLINYTFNNNQTGDWHFSVSCDDGTDSDLQYFNLTIPNENRAPILDPIGNLAGEVGENFFKQLTGSDPDGDPITWNADTTLFSIGVNGSINFTPTTQGNFTINISISDGNLSDWEVINFTILLTSFCGDLLCSGQETCSSCQVDCGVCPAGTSTGTGSATGESGSGGGAGGVADAQNRGFGAFICIESWDCTEWSLCIDEQRTRTCIDRSRCATEIDKPDETESCEVILPPDETCFDEILNQGEDEVDCGGPCAPCIVKRLARLPPLPPDILTVVERIIPWIIGLLVLIIATVLTVADRTYVKYIEHKPFPIYRSRMHTYRPYRKIIYLGIINMFIMSLIAMLYYFVLSIDPASIRKFAGVPISLGLITPFIVYFIMRKYEYDEDKESEINTLLKTTHLRQRLQLKHLEVEWLINTEKYVNVLFAQVQEEEIIKAFEKVIPEIKRMEEIHTLLSDEEIFQPTAITSVKAIGNAAASELGKFHDPKAKKVSRQLRRLVKSLDQNYFNQFETSLRYESAIKYMARDKHLVAVMSTDKELTSRYNEAIDIYQYIKKHFDQREELQKEETQIEQKLVPLLDGIFSDTDFKEKFQSNKTFVKLFNNLIDLYNYYKSNTE